MNIWQRFVKKKCEKCEKEYDPLEEACPFCHEINPIIQKGDRALAVLDWKKEVGLFGVGTLGFYIFGLLLSLIITSIAQNVLYEAGFTGASLTTGLNDYISSASYTILVNYLVYLLMLVTDFFLIGKCLHKVFDSFKNPKFAFGFAIGIVIFGVSMLLTYLLSFAGTHTSDNQVIIDQASGQYALLTAILTIVIAPLVEELTYRVGLFTVLKRINVYFAYAAVAIIFGLMHMKNFASLNEWLNVIVYMVGGLCLTFAYHHFGFAGSFTAHLTYNLIGTIWNTLA